MQTQFEVKNQNIEGPTYCHKCGGTAQLKPGPALFVTGTWGAVCQACAERQQPTIRAELEAARACYAKEYARWMR